MKREEIKLTIEEAFEIIKKISNDELVRIEKEGVVIEVHPMDCNEHRIEMEMDDIVFSDSVYASEIFATTYYLNLGRIEIRYTKGD